MRLWLETNQIEELTRSSPAEWYHPVLIQHMSMDPILLSRDTTGVMVQIARNPALLALDPSMKFEDFTPTPFEDLANTDKMLPRLYATDVEISHGVNVMAFAIRFTNTCLEAIDKLDDARRQVGLPLQLPGARAMVEDRIRFTQSRCHALQDRFHEIRERHRSQINAVSPLRMHTL